MHSPGLSNIVFGILPESDRRLVFQNVPSSGILIGFSSLVERTFEADTFSWTLPADEKHAYTYSFQTFLKK